MREYKLYLRDILQAAESIEDFIGDMTFDEFRRDDKTVSAVYRKFEIIGEAAKNIPADVKKQYPNVPWKGMAGLRDVLIHKYFAIDADRVWRTAQNRIPSLKVHIRSILEDLD